MSTTYKRLLLLPMALAVGIWVVLDSGANAAGGGAGYHPPDIGATASEIVFPVRVAVAARGPLQRSVNVAGTLRSVRSFPVAFRVSGVLVRHMLWNGRPVREGEELCALDDRGFRREHELAASQLLAAQIEYRSLAGSTASRSVDTTAVAMEVQRAMERIRAVDAAWENGVLPPSEYRRQQRDATTKLAYLSADRGDVIALKCGLASAMEREERTRQSLEASVVRAPFPGVLANCTVETGAVVQAGTSLGTLIDARHLLLDADVLESEIGLVREGDSAVVEVPAIGPARFAGRVAHVNPVHESATRSALVTIQVALRGVHHSGRVAGPRPGMYGTARIIVDRLPGRILVPRTAVLFRSARNMVFLVRGNRSHWAYVDVGEESETTVAITRGVAPGDTVIVDGHFALGHDARVRIVAGGGAE